MFSASAQDMIVKKNGTIIKAKVIKVGSSEVEYKKWTNQNNIHLIQYLKNELNKMPNSSFIKYIWLNTAIQECVKFDKNLYIISELSNFKTIFL